ncbi:MAG: spore photoproduct lyase family protein [candidate division WOR-3 bacterium]
MRRKIVFIKKYDYGKGVFDLGEYVISYATSCSLGCEYCYLQFAKTPREPVIYENLEVLEQELKELFLKEEERNFYFNLGETTDSFLSQNHIEIIDRIGERISFFAERYNKRVFLELRTKTDNILKFSSLNKKKNLFYIYGISLLPEETIINFEKNTASLESRIESIKKAQELSYLIGLRFEPIIIYPVFGITYEEVINSLKNIIINYQEIFFKIFKILDVSRLHSISFGALRLTKKQYKYLKEKKSKLAFFEMVLAPDKKYRYSRPLRVYIYQELIKSLKEIFGNKIIERIYLATEFPYIWKACNLPLKLITGFIDI